MFRELLAVALVGMFTSLAACGSSQSKPGDPGAKPAASAEAPSDGDHTDKMR